MRKESLGRIAGDLIGYVQLFRDAPDSARPSSEDLRSHLLNQLDAIANSNTARSMDQSELDLARFFLVAWADETILRSNWSGQAGWSNALLQTHLFATNKGGDEFYARLAALPPEFNQAREIAFLCLSMGFEGNLLGNESARHELIRQQYETLRVAGMATDSSAPRYLAAPAYNLEIEVHGGQGRSLLPVVGTWIVGTAVGFGLLFLTLWWLAGGVATPPEF